MNNIQTVEQLDALGVKITKLLEQGVNKAPIILSDTISQILQWEFCRSTLGITGSLLIFFASIIF